MMDWYKSENTSLCVVRTNRFCKEIAQVHVSSIKVMIRSFFRIEIVRKYLRTYQEPAGTIIDFTTKVVRVFGLKLPGINKLRSRIGFGTRFYREFTIYRPAILIFESYMKYLI